MTGGVKGRYFVPFLNSRCSAAKNHQQRVVAALKKAMPFRALFVLATADLYLHGPGDEKEKIAAALASVLAILLHMQLAYVLAELVWFAVFVRAWQSPSSGQRALPQIEQGPLATAAAAPAQQPGLPEAPAELRQAVDESLAVFLKNIGPTSSDGDAWSVLTQDGPVTVSSTPYKGQNFLRWKLEISNVWGPAQGIYDELFDYNKRCGPNGWDKALSGGRIHKQFADGYRVVIYATAPALGGLVTGREFVDGRVLKFPAEGGVLVGGLGLDAKKWKDTLGANYPEGDSSLTRALSFPGGGFVLSAANGQAPADKSTPALWKFTMVTAVLLGGWLPQSSINSATSQVMLESAKLTVEHLKKKFPRD